MRLINLTWEAIDSFLMINSKIDQIMTVNVRGGTPRYQLLAQQLADDIYRGKVAVGALMPPEKALCEKYGVSRHTVREALRQLQAMGLVVAKRGVGTQVVSDRPVSQEGGFRSIYQSIDHLIQFAEETQLHITQVSDIISDAELAKTLGCKEGAGFLSIEAIRLHQEEQKPVLWLNAYVAATYSSIEHRLDGYQGTISRLVENEYGIKIREIKQSIQAISLSKELAQVLELETGTPALQITRTYYSDNNEIVEYAKSVQAHGVDMSLTNQD